MTRPASTCPICEITLQPSLPVSDRQFSGTDLRPSFAFSTRWLPQSTAASTSKTASSSIGLKANLLTSGPQPSGKSKKANISFLTLKKPNPCVYTRPELGRKENDQMEFGEKTFHFKGKRDDWSHLGIRLVSDGVDQNTAIKIEVRSCGLL